MSEGRVRLVNGFVVREGSEDAFVALWERTGAILRTLPGFVDAELHRALANQPMRAPYTHLNVATWTSAEAYHAAIRDPRIAALAPDYRELATMEPALYEPASRIAPAGAE